MNISYEDFFKLSYSLIDLNDEEYLKDEERLRYIIRQRRQHGGVPADGGGTGHCGYDRGRLLCLCQHLPGGQEP